MIIDMNDIILIEKIENLLSENNGQIAEVEVCKVLNITSLEIPWGYNIGWARCLQLNQTYDLVSRSRKPGFNYKQD
jgi:hypothetical protein